MNKPVLEKRDRILIIGETESEKLSLANALAAGYGISAAPNVFEAAGRMKKETFSVILFNLRDASADIENIIQILQEHRILRVPVTERGRLVGIISRSDIIRAVLEPEFMAF